MDTELLIRTFPKLYHMAHVDAWEGICRHGLLSTVALLDLFEIQGSQRERIFSMRRPKSVLIQHPVHGKAVIRDNIPMDDTGLERALTAVTPREWYELLNGKVFFWLSEERLDKLISAGAYRGHDHCVITLSTSELVRRHEKRITLSSINSGCTKPYPHPRGRDLFQPIQDYRFEHFRQRRSSPKKAVVELAVDYAVPDLLHCVQKVEIRNSIAQAKSIYTK